MKKYVFIVLVFFSVHTKSNAAQFFYDLCSDVVNPSVSNMTVNYSNGTTNTIGIEDFCQEFARPLYGRSSSDQSISSLPNTLALVGIVVGIAAPFLKTGIKYSYNYIYRKYYGQKTEPEKTADIINKAAHIKASTDLIPQMEEFTGLIKASTDLIPALNGTINQIRQHQIESVAPQS